MLGACEQPFVSAYDLAMLDLDGVVYVAGHAIEGVPEHLRRLRASGMHLAFITNNASRTPEKVSANLRKFGVEAAASDVVTSSQAAARLLLDRFGAGSRVLMLGAAGLDDALRDLGLVPVAASDPEPVALVTGYGPDVIWRDVMRATVRVHDGLPWVASNTDLSIPTGYGIAPGHGMLCGMIERFTGVQPTVAGKPQRPLLDETVRRVGGGRPLMVGDRLDTDIEGAHNAGVDSLLVLTGVSGLADLVTAPPKLRPTYLSPGLEGLFVAPRGALGRWGHLVAGRVARPRRGHHDGNRGHGRRGGLVAGGRRGRLGPPGRERQPRVGRRAGSAGPAPDGGRELVWPHECADRADPTGAAETGDVEVDLALRDLARLDQMPVEEHLDVLEHTHEQLRDRLHVRRPSDAG